MPNKPSVLVTRGMPRDVAARLNRDYDARLNVEDRLLSQDELLRRAEGCQAVLCTPTEKMDAETIAGLPEDVKILATFSVGFEHIDLEAAGKKGVIVTNTPDVLTNATADIAMLLILAAARRAYEGERLVREDKWIGWKPDFMLGTDVTGKRLGILGMGRIGETTAKRARGFDMAIHYSKRQRLSPEQEQGAVYHQSIEAMLPQCDFLSIHCPATPETHHLINEERLALMPDGAIVVNTARGTIVDDTALIAALKSGKIAAAGLDVFEGEPKINPAYRDLPNAFLLPHVGSATIETRNAMGFKCLENLDAYFKGDAPPDRLI
ncbi:D-glycerate dehydrogenase [Pelagibius sp. Alg239-R121]|uniref:2-hydroxyacid dehydrogenase n=1 Tax=Pelagibius sp. Alg239-R121 TaxID=2993448 RepID=UPI0024A7107F|nr:D-glycerate dehydrogenase [Pelagibius sp. Alg239-R121]